MSSMAFYGWPVSQCQSVETPLPVQFANGIRMVDIRLAVKHGELIAYHGTYPQRATFQSILTDIHDFLSAPETCRETLVISIKQEDYGKHDAHLFSSKVKEEVEAGPGGMGMWFWENRIPYLGEVRGKAIMFSRFGADGREWGGLEPMGINPTTWPDSRKLGFSWQCKDTLVRTQDWYVSSEYGRSTHLLTEPLGTTFLHSFPSRRRRHCRPSYSCPLHLACSSAHYP